MSYHITRNPNGLVTVKLIGEQSVEDIKTIFDEITQDGKFESNKRIWDISQAKIPSESKILREMANLSVSRDLPNSRVATISTDDLNFGLLRMHEAFRADNGTEMCVFRNPEDAKAWLEEPL